MDIHRIPRSIRGWGAARPGRSFGAWRHVDKEPVSTELTPIARPSPDSPQQRAVLRKFVAFGHSQKPVSVSRGPLVDRGDERWCCYIPRSHPYRCGRRGGSRNAVGDPRCEIADFETREDLNAMQ